MSGTLSLLRIPDLRTLLTARFISMFGSAATVLAVQLLVLDLTGSTAALGLTAVLAALPSVTIGFVAGGVADRLNRRQLMIGADLIRAVLVLLIIPASQLGEAAFPVIAVLTLLQGIAGSFFSPANSAVIARLVPEDRRVNIGSLQQTLLIVTNLLGVSFAGIVLGLSNNRDLLFAIDAVSFLVAGSVMFLIPRKVGTPEVSAESLAERKGLGLREGLAVVRASRMLIAITVGPAIVMLGVGAINVLFVPFVYKELQAPLALAGVIEGSMLVSMLIGSALAPALVAKISAERALWGALIACGTLLLLWGGVTELWQFVALLFALGFAQSPINIVASTIFMNNTTDAVRGRVGAVFSGVTEGASLLSMAGAGAAAALVGMRGTFVAAGVLCLVGGIVTALLVTGAVKERTQRT
ncbi:MAG: MFS transporter [Candidatus Limnocylindrus sp.]